MKSCFVFTKRNKITKRQILFCQLTITDTEQTKKLLLTKQKYQKFPKSTHTQSKGKIGRAKSQARKKENFHDTSTGTGERQYN